METVLSLKNVSKNIKGKSIIKDVSFDVHKGQIYGFLGPNGAGKTMTLRIIVGLISSTSGSVEICGHDIQKSFVKAMSNVGCIIENPEFYEYLSGIDNLEFLGKMEAGISHENIDEVVELVGLSNRINDKVGTYSLGMKQRLGIAQALMKSPDLLILDEPTNGLDPAGIREFRTLVKSLSKEHGMTIFVSSHLLSEIQMICDEVAIILHGEIIKTSKVENLSSDQKITWHVTNVQKAKEILKKDFGIAAIKESEESISAFTDDSQLTAINKALMSSNIGLKFVSKQQKSLEDLFMELTGGETIG
ncbi:ABC transporter ATP-binding protein [Gudongella sp. DL1XJH-153]|uniref:ABC transporter ATP-binding protein n=1 Tax=Gudongella sp. DL1XJH-153 TaxID=3409804 RepID=UPI003BB7D2CF